MTAAPDLCDRAGCDRLGTRLVAFRATRGLPVPGRLCIEHHAAAVADGHLVDRLTGRAILPTGEVEPAHPIPHREPVSRRPAPTQEPVMATPYPIQIDTAKARLMLADGQRFDVVASSFGVSRTTLRRRLDEAGAPTVTAPAVVEPAATPTKPASAPTVVGPYTAARAQALTDLDALRAEQQATEVRLAEVRRRIDACEDAAAALAGLAEHEAA